MARKTGKEPGFFFYVRDWTGDPQLRQATPATRGMWADMLCFMHSSPTRGELTGTRESLARMLGVTPTEFDHFMQQATEHKFADVTECNLNVTVRNRRMYREDKTKRATALRVQRHRRNAKGNGDVTPASSFSYSNPPPIIPPHSENDGEKATIPSFQPQMVSDLWNGLDLPAQTDLRQDLDTRDAIVKAIGVHGADQVEKAIRAYAAVLGSDEHYFKHVWCLKLFLEKGIRQFLPEVKPLENFLIRNRDRPGGSDESYHTPKL